MMKKVSVSLSFPFFLVDVPPCRCYQRSNQYIKER